jgi:cytochrome d ubiquinol oxidase subunit II
MPAVYFPISVMVLSLIFRGVAFEFRYRDSEHRSLWDHGFNYGSLLATFAQGIVLGAFVQGFRTDGYVFTGSSLDCFTPFSVLVGVCLVFGYALLGAGWLVLKTDGRMQSWARALGRWAFLGVCVAILLVSIWTSIAFPDIRSRWFSWPDIALLTPVPIVTAVVAWLEWRTLNRADSEAGPFIGAVALFALSYLGIGISLFPYVVPHRLTLWQAAANPSAQVFLLIGTLFLLPVILMYTGYSYWVFRGKVRTDVGYH